MRLAQIDGGMVVNLVEVDPQAIPDFAAGWPEADVPEAQIGAAWDAETGFQPVVIPPTAEAVNRERQRRVLAGATFAIPGASVRLTGDETTTTNLQALAFAAQLRLASGDSTTQTPFRDADNTIHQLVPAQVLQLWSAAAAWVSATFLASWTLKDNPTGIPPDYADDIHWPS